MRRCLRDPRGNGASLGLEAETRSDRQPARRTEAWEPGEDRLLATEMRACAGWARS
jgi:hypothetical protein